MHYVLSTCVVARKLSGIGLKPAKAPRQASQARRGWWLVVCRSIVRISGEVEQFNLASYFVDRHIAEGRGTQTAIVYEGGRYSYAEIAALVNQAGNWLRRAGVEQGDRVLIILPDSPEFVAAYFGAIRIGAVAVPTSTALRPADYAYLAAESQAKIVWAQIGDVQYEHEPPELDCAPTAPDDPAFWLWTSGSTGPPKAAVHRHADWLASCEGYARGVLGIRSDDVTFSSAKLFHAYGLGNGLMFPFYVGATTVLYPGKPQASAILARAHECRPTLFFSVPTHLAAMLRETDAGCPYDLSSVPLGVSAAEPLPAEIVRRWRERFGFEGAGGLGLPGGPRAAWPLPAKIARRWRERFGFEVRDGIGSTEVLHIYISNRCRPAPRS